MRPHLVRLLVPLSLIMVMARVAMAQSPAAAFIVDLRPTTLAPGDTLVIECPGLVPGTPAHVALEGRRATGHGALAFSGVGRALRGDRVLLKLQRPEPVRLEQVNLEVRQGARTWKLPPGRQLSLEFTPPTLHQYGSDLAMALRGAPTDASPLASLLAFLPYLLVGAVALLIHMLVAPITGLVVVWERKIWGRMQSRIGPNRVGPGGWLQWLADGIKMILKEDVVPAEADAHLFRFAPYLMWMSIFATFVVLPLSATVIVADLNVGLLYLVSITAFTVIAVLLGGWASNSKWSLIGGMRSAAQIVSYELPAAMALLQVVLLAGTLAPQALVRAQGGLPHEWFVFANPFTFASFFIYFIAGLAEGNRTPFDLPEAESELVAGFTTEYSGFRYGVFSLAEWTNVYVLGAIITTAFLGGWNVPFVSPDVVAASAGWQALGAAVMLGKVVVLVFVIIWIRATLPRFRLDQLMDLCWKYLIPLSFALFLLTAGWVWLIHVHPLLDTVSRWLTLGGGVALLALFVVRVVVNFRSSRLLPA